MVTGDGLLTSDGDFWLRQRRMMQPAFHRQKVAAFGQKMVQAAERMLARWETLPDNTELDVDHEMMKLTLEVVGHTLFSVDLSNGANELVQAVLTTLDYVVYRAQSPLALPLNIPTPRNQAVNRSLELLDNAIDRLVAERRRMTEKPSDLLQMLLEARTEADEPMSQGQMRDEIITLLIAGHETVASALTWTWHLLAQNPLAEIELNQELTRVLGGRLPTMEAWPNLPYTRAVFDEALRLYPPAWLITRKAIAADMVAGYAVPAGALVIISPYIVHREPSVWEAPQAFKPKRFLEDHLTPRYAYLPFGGGPRVCIGNVYALTEGVLVLASVAQKFQLRAVSDHRVYAEPLVTIRPRGGLPMTLHRR
jgi:cytochrome P450